MANYQYVLVDTELVFDTDFDELIADAVEDSLDTCRRSEDGKYIILKYLGDMPVSFVKHQAALSTPKRKRAFIDDDLKDPTKKLQHEKDKREIVLKFKKGNPTDGRQLSKK